MITNLMNLTHFQLYQTSSIKQFLPPSSSSPSLEEDNIEGLIAKATRKNTIIYSTTADNEDLQQLMNMFKPFCKNVTMDTSNTQMNNHMDTFTIYINKLDHWINKTKMINEFIHKKQINLNIIHLINEQLNQLDHNLTIILDKYPFDVSIRLSNQLITIMELLLTQVRLLGGLECLKFFQVYHLSFIGIKYHPVKRNHQIFLLIIVKLHHIELQLNFIDNENFVLKQKDALFNGTFYSNGHSL